MSNARDKANIPALNFSSTGIDDNATSTAITINSSEQVGIGTSSPVSKLTVGDSLYSYELTKIGSGGLSNQDIIVLICEKEVETIHLVGRFYTPKTGTGNGYSRNSFLVNVNFFADDVVGTTPQIVFDGQYRGIHANFSDNLKVVEATVDGTTYWGFIIQNLGSYQGPGPIYFDGGITSISNFNFCYRGDASSVTIVTPSNSASSSKIIATQNFKLRNEIHGNVLTTSNNGDISFYEDTGTTPKFFWDSSAEALGIGTTSPQEKLDIDGNIAISGNTLFEEVTSTAGMPSSAGNKTVNTNYDSTFSLTAGKWLILVNASLQVFQTSSNDIGLYLLSLSLGSSAGADNYGLIQKSVLKWGNGTNSYGDNTGGHFPTLTLGSTTTLHTRWRVTEYGTASNFWVRGNLTKIRCIRIG